MAGFFDLSSPCLEADSSPAPETETRKAARLHSAIMTVELGLVVASLQPDCARTGGDAGLSGDFFRVHSPPIVLHRNLLLML
ncbi:hypothetical protein J5N97_028973 [Dioscorea zingiberensis]|uniref:Uncharacterized protein n=1 Tax=Dioscorea zingiberensis TaxID=325984 RepID=A0A9D5BZW9_9LILI|nr:hypothetical protein J5N97_028973 [Dioscorea zingiberensis]